jgi:hypothetical protein
MSDGLFAVVTTIQEPTPALQRLCVRLRAAASPLIVIGDRKGPASFELEGSRFFPLSEQRQSGFCLATELPEAHYARKNLGYLQAIAAGATSIYETDDDNAPLPHWSPRNRRVTAIPLRQAGNWTNAYRAFTTEKIWPRGFPLDAIASGNDAFAEPVAPPRTIEAPIQQGLANGSPDVDAIWRLVLDRDFTFVDGPSVLLEKDNWCPFNSQSTWWWPEAYPLLYLPSHCSFRMTDIWRSFIAQRCLWALGYGVVFHAPEVVQERNAHVLMRDFADEVPGYLRNRELADALAAIDLDPGQDRVIANLVRCYSALVDRQFFPSAELTLVQAWANDLTGLQVPQASSAHAL